MAQPRKFRHRAWFVLEQAGLVGQGKLSINGAMHVFCYTFEENLVVRILGRGQGRKESPVENLVNSHCLVVNLIRSWCCAIWGGVMAGTGLWSNAIVVF